MKHHIPTLQSMRKISAGILRVQGQVEEERSIEDAEKMYPERVPELIIMEKVILKTFLESEQMLYQ